MKKRFLLLDTIGESGLKLFEEYADVADGRGFTKDRIIECIGEFDAVIIKSGNFIDADILRKAVKLKVIARAGSGTDSIDMSLIRSLGIELIRSPEGNACSVAEYVICMSILLGHKLLEANAGSGVNDFQRHKWQGRNLKSMTMAVIGLGVIGREVVRKAAPLCHKVIGYSNKTEAKGLDDLPNFELSNNFRETLSECDILSLHIPLTGETTNLLNDTSFGYLKKGTVLINTSRGRVIDEKALLKALKTGVVQMAALDTLSAEPEFNTPGDDTTYSHFLINHPGVFYTPHIAAGTRDALEEVSVNLAKNVKAFFETAQ
jgi:phosphoglycerate dehydrogenase-like enzyme